MTGNEMLQYLQDAGRLGGAGSSDFDLNPEFRLAGRELRPAAVLVAVAPGAGAPRLYLTKRASTLKHHPGQIAFPGGKLDKADRGSPDAAALREAEEEIGLPRTGVTLLGRLAAHETVTGFSVTPVLGVISEPFEPRPEAGEVDEIFTVPLAHVLDPGNFLVQSRIWRGARRFYYTVPYGPYYIWGATARILRVLAEGTVP